ncbi:MAG: TetR/AcrR family transcriptional regulator [Acidimicrobiaceae bacterium]|nr:TetR/AcrR family transcriptional regulator [Acidimicrobiaceae bacterium]
MDRRVERGRATREHLVAAATDLFAEHGYDHTSIDAVLEKTGVSRGSLYHHFSSKQALFEAAVHRLEAQVGEAVTAEALAAGDPDPAAALRAGCLAWIRLAGDPVVRRVLLIDAPAVLGWRRWREIEEQYAFGTTKEVVHMAAEQGRLPLEVVDPLAHMVLASVNELALLIALSDDVPAAQASAQAAVDEFFQRLLPSAKPATRRRR